MVTSVLLRVWIGGTSQALCRRETPRRRFYFEGVSALISFHCRTRKRDARPLGSSKTSLIINSSPWLPCAHMCRNTRVHTKAPFMLFISQPSGVMWSIKGLFDFYSTQAVMRHLWEAHFKSHLGSSLCCRCYATLSQKQCNCAYMKTCLCTRLLTTNSPPVWEKCKCVLLSPITAACLGILFIKDVICYSALSINLGIFYTVVLR